jgi:hypothetical protein
MKARVFGIIASIAIASTFCVMVGCHSSGDTSSSSAAAASEPTTQSAIPIPPDSPLAKVRMGEEKAEVIQTLGPPTSESSYQTGKAWIPFHFSGSDVYRTADHYKGMGIVTYGNDSAYSSGMAVVDIQYNPNEPGY